MADFVEVDERAVEAARARGAEEFSCPRALSARFDAAKGRVVVALETGGPLILDPKSLKGLREAKPADLSDVVVDGGGFTLTFPQLDADYGLPYLIEKFGVAGEPRGKAIA